MDFAQLHITLIASPEDASLYSIEYQKELEDVEAFLGPYNPRAEALISEMQAVASLDITGDVILLGKFVIALKPALPAVVPIASGLVAWCAARYGRKIRVKVGDIEVEAQTQAEVESLLVRAEEIRERSEPKKILP
jgi:hypothetical protein